MVGREAHETTIRPATLADVGRLDEIENAAFEGDRISRRSFRRQLQSPTLATLVATEHHVIRGYILIACRRNARAARIYSLAVEAAEGRGIGRQLMEAGETLARKRGYVTMRLEVKNGNARAIGIYERSGYRQIGRRDDYYEDGGAALLYEKALTS